MLMVEKQILPLTTIRASPTAYLKMGKRAINSIFKQDG
jgi:hypothetical protein